VAREPAQRPSPPLAARMPISNASSRQQRARAGGRQRQIRPRKHPDRQRLERAVQMLEITTRQCATPGTRLFVSDGQGKPTTPAFVVDSGSIVGDHQRSRLFGPSRLASSKHSSRTTRQGPQPSRPRWSRSTRELMRDYDNTRAKYAELKLEAGLKPAPAQNLEADRKGRALHID